MRGIRLVYEDPVSLAVLERLVQLHAPVLTIEKRIPGQGFGTIRKNIAKYNQAARTLPFFILTDLDQWKCPPGLITQWLPHGKSTLLLFRIAVREVESWLLADREGFAAFLGISPANLKTQPDLLPDPKAEVFRLTRKSRSRNLKEDILPMENASIGPGYNSAIPRFVRDAWSPHVAQAHSPSLDRTMRALETFVDRG